MASEPAAFARAPAPVVPLRKVDPGTLIERRLRAAELAAQRARDRHAEAEALLSELSLRAEQLELELERALREPQRLRGLLAERDRQRRDAEQRAHSERALRRELQDELDRRAVPSIEAAALAEAEECVRELEEERMALREQLRRAERRTVTRSEELAAVIAGIRGEFERLAATVERERHARVVAERRVTELERELHERELAADATPDAVEELRDLLAELRGGSGEELAAAGTPAKVEPERFDAALSRLRAVSPADPEPPRSPEPAPVRPARPWLRDAFAGLVARDPEAAGRLLVGLLPAQATVHAGELAYDLVIGRLVIQLTVADRKAEISTAAVPRELAEVAFRITGDHAAIARLVDAGKAPRLIRRGRARVDGARGQISALVGLVRTPLGLDALYDAGVRLDARLALTLAAAMVPAEWSAVERFAIAHIDGRPVYLNLGGGEPATVTDEPAAAVATTIACPGCSLLGVLAGDLEVAPSISGDATPLLALLGWLERAQRG